MNLELPQHVLNEIMNRQNSIHQQQPLQPLQQPLQQQRIRSRRLGIIFPNIRSKNCYQRLLCRNVTTTRIKGKNIYIGELTDVRGTKVSMGVVKQSVSNYTHLNVHEISRLRYMRRVLFNNFEQITSIRGKKIISIIFETIENS